MGVLSPKTRLISFRLSKPEYDCLRVLCSAHGARSLSDFVRESMCWIINNSGMGLSQFSGPSASDLVLSKLLPAVRMLSPEPSHEETLREFEDLRGMVLTLNRKTDSLDREIKQLTILMKLTRASASVTNGDEKESAEHLETEEASAQ